MKKKITENISLKIRKHFMVSRVKIFLISAILIVSFVAFNLWMRKLELPKYDITENKIYSLSEESKETLKKVDKKVNLAIYGYTEDSILVGLIKQYAEANNNITYEFLKDETNPDKINKYYLEKGNEAVVCEVEGQYKVLYSSDFYTYDYTTWQQIDTTEDAVTNAILNLAILDRPKVYFSTGHGELDIENYLSSVVLYLQNEVFDVNAVNLLTSGKVPDDASVFVICSPTKDLLDQEEAVLEEYINNGGNVLVTNDLITSSEFESFTNWGKILSLYGIRYETGFVYETDVNKIVSLTQEASPYIFQPNVENSKITTNIQSDGGLVLEGSARINLAEEEQNNLNVSYEKLLTSSNESYFIKNNFNNPISEIDGQEKKQSVISAKATKILSNEGEEEKKSEMVFIANTAFISNVQSSISSNGQATMQVSIANNANFFVNVVANLTAREDTIKIRKGMNSSTFLATQKQDIIVRLIIYLIPIFIIILGIIVWNVRKHKR